MALANTQRPDKSNALTATLESKLTTFIILFDSYTYIYIIYFKDEVVDIILHQIKTTGIPGMLHQAAPTALLVNTSLTTYLLIA